MKLYVTAVSGAMIPHYGSRERGQYWDNLPAEIIADLKDHPDFSTSDPAKKEVKKKEAPEIREES